MAARGKTKEYTTRVTTVAQWVQELDFPGLLVVEVFSSAFGPCQVVAPMIHSIMLQYDDPMSKIKWLQINVAQLENDSRQKYLQQQNKKHEETVVLRRRNPDASSMTEEEQEDLKRKLEKIEQEEQRAKEHWDTVTVPKLEAYSGYDNPRPLWVFIKGSTFLTEVRDANPPKMMLLCKSFVNGTQVDQKELDDMEFQIEDDADGADEKKDEDEPNIDDHLKGKLFIELELKYATK
jgi:hypothetical protein